MTLHTALVRTAEKCARMVRAPEGIYPYKGTESVKFYVQNLGLHVNALPWKYNAKERNLIDLRKRKEELLRIINYVTSPTD